MQTIDIQRALLKRGYDLGPSQDDGVWGRASIAALKRFQVDGHMPATGVVGPPVLAALIGADAQPLPVFPAWYHEAQRLMGLHEGVGSANNPTILGWARKIGGWVGRAYTADSIPWCALFAAHCIGATLPDETLPANPLSALAYAKFGIGLGVPAIGAVCVFVRSGGGHVAFYAGEDADTIHVVGGNQSDAVTLTREPRARLRCYRWPATSPRPQGGPVQRAAVGALSASEA